MYHTGSASLRHCFWCLKGYAPFFFQPLTDYHNNGNQYSQWYVVDDHYTITSTWIWLTRKCALVDADGNLKDASESEIEWSYNSDKDGEMGLEDEELEHDSNAHEILPAVSKVPLFILIVLI